MASEAPAAGETAAVTPTQDKHEELPAVSTEQTSSQQQDELGDASSKGQEHAATADAPASEDDARQEDQPAVVTEPVAEAEADKQAAAETYAEHVAPVEHDVPPPPSAKASMAAATEAAEPSDPSAREAAPSGSQHGRTDSRESTDNASRPLPEPTSASASTSAGGPSSRRSVISNRSSTSISSIATHSRSSLTSLTKGSAVFVITALESIEKSKEARKSKELKDACSRALEMIRTASASTASSTGTVPGGGTAEAILDPRTVFEPLRLACAMGSSPVVITAIDCISKLVSYAFFAEDYPSPPQQQQQQAPLADVVTDTICNAFTESSDDKAQLQIIKALLTIVLSNSIHVHQGSLLKAVRTVYNIFLLSKSPANQAVAQGNRTLPALAAP